VVGVVSAGAPTYARSWEAGEPVSVPVTTLLADGMACRTPIPAALDVIRAEVDHLVEVDDEEVAAAMSLLFTATHNVAEGAGAAALAAAMKEKDTLTGERVGVVVSGGNVDRDVFARTLA
jgi:threonine dehydratase